MTILDRIRSAWGLPTYTAENALAAPIPYYDRETIARNLDTCKPRGGGSLFASGTPLELYEVAFLGCDIVNLCHKTIVDKASLVEPIVYKVRGTSSDRNATRKRVKSLLQSDTPLLGIEMEMQNMVDTDKLVPIEDHPFLHLLQRPNKTTLRTYRDLLDAVLLYQYVSGSVFIERFDADLPVYLDVVSLLIGNVEIMLNASGFDVERYKYTFKQNHTEKTKLYNVNQIIHIKNYNPKNPMYGRAELFGALKLIDSYIRSHAWNNNRLKNEFSGEGFLVYKNPDDATPLTRAQLSQADMHLKKNATGAENAGNIGATNVPADFIRTGYTPKEMSWLEGLEMLMRRISANLGVPSSLIGDNAAATFSNRESDEKRLYHTTVLPFVGNVLMNLGNALLPSYGNDLVVWFDTSNISALAEDRELVLKTIQATDGILTTNEHRAMLNYPPIK